MKSKIAVVTVSGKAYYRLVNELKQRKLFFLSLIPGEPIPPSIKIVITTSQERALIHYPNVLVYDAETDPSDILDKAVRIVQAKESYNEVAIGVDPGKTFGLAVLGDGKVLKKFEELSLELAMDTIFLELRKNPAKVQRVRIGNGIPNLAEEVTRRLNIALLNGVLVEMVKESGTSSLREDGSKKKVSDADSAVNIATKKGNIKLRRTDI